MEFRALGHSGLSVSTISMGTMTFGEQNTEAEGHALLDIAADHGINFLDAAELYPVSPRPETQGRTEQIVGSWVKARGNRDRVIIASKVVAKSPAMPWFRGPDHCLDRANINAALDASLHRLQTDYLDVYYLHWPDRQTNFFGRLGYDHNPDQDGVPLEESLSALADAVRAGKIRHIAVSNETPWGLHRCLLAAEQAGLPRIACIQNPYSLLNRTFEIGLAELAIREQVPLIAYSPLAGGVLTGKYRNGAKPQGARVTRWPDRYSRYTKPAALIATDQYCTLAQSAGWSPAAMALRYCMEQPFLASAIVGATTPQQFTENLQAIDRPLGDALTAAIEAIHQAHPNPAP